ncbi:Hypothetical predicted protein, partial [Paramuricea clavata]
MSREDDRLQRAKDALKNASQELESEPQSSSPINNARATATRSPNVDVVDQQRQSAPDDF